MRVHLWPQFSGVDAGDGGVRRVVEGQEQVLPAHGIELVDHPEDAELIAAHIKIPRHFYVRHPDKPIVAHCHGLYWSEYEWASWAMKANAEVMELIRIADITTAPTEWVAQAIRRATMRDVRVVPHGVNAAEWLELEPDRAGRSEHEEWEREGYVLWNKTRPDPVCDPEPLNEIARRMRDVQFATTFGDEAPNVLVSGRLPFLTAKRQVQRAGVYLATTRETFGVGTLEALAAGVPVVGWAFGGQEEILHHKADGWLAPVGDYESLEQGIRWALANRGDLRDACRHTAMQFTWERAGAMYAEIYAEAYHRRFVRAADPLAETPSPKVSVIVTAYALEQFLDACLKSVAEQTLGEFECIIVDDASPDNCGRIADAWAERDPRFRAIHNETNQYLAAARNTGIEYARGQYILPLDADDMLDPDALMQLSSALDADRTTHIAYGGVYFIEEDGNPTVYKSYEWTPGHSGWPMDFRFDWQMMQRNLLPYCSMFRREVWELTGGYRARFRTAEDADFWSRASSYGFRPRMVTQHDTLIYRNRAGSMSRREQGRDWTAWFPWSRDPALTPAGAATEQQLPVPSADPPEVSVVIPVGPGHARYLLDAIDSVDAQTFRAWECIVVNDSADDLPSLPSWVRVVELDGSPLGVARARNAGIEAARAPLFLPLDADDYLQPDAIALMMQARGMSDGDTIYSDFYEDPHREGEYQIWSTVDWKPEDLIAKGIGYAVTALTEKARWAEVGGYPEDVPGWEDWAFQIELAKRGYCARRIALPLFTYRKHTGKRRNENVEAFEESKAGIMKRYGEYWSGGAELMACRTCGGGGTFTGSPGPQFSPGAPPPEGAVMMVNNSNQRGKVRYRGPSQTIYRFEGGDRLYVLKEDVAFFLQLPSFAVVDNPSMPVSGEPLEVKPQATVEVMQAGPQPAQEAGGGASASDEPPAGDPLASVASEDDDAISVAIPPGASMEEAVELAKAATEKKRARAKS